MKKIIISIFLFLLIFIVGCSSSGNMNLVIEQMQRGDFASASEILSNSKKDKAIILANFITEYEDLLLSFEEYKSRIKKQEIYPDYYGFEEDLDIFDIYEKMQITKDKFETVLKDKNLSFIEEKFQEIEDMKNWRLDLGLLSFEYRVFLRLIEDNYSAWDAYSDWMTVFEHSPLPDYLEDEQNSFIYKKVAENLEDPNYYPDKYLKENKKKLIAVYGEEVMDYCFEIIDNSIQTNNKLLREIVAQADKLQERFIAEGYKVKKFLPELNTLNFSIDIYNQGNKIYGEQYSINDRQEIEDAMMRFVIADIPNQGDYNTYIEYYLAEKNLSILFLANGNILEQKIIYN